MNSLSYASPEMLASTDGLPYSLRAGEGVKTAPGSPTSSPRSSSPESKRRATPPPACHARTFKGSEAANPQSEKKPERIHGPAERVESVYVLRRWGCAAQGKSDQPHVHENCKMLSWKCGRCEAKLRDGRGDEGWQDGYCGRCGVLNLEWLREVVAADAPADVKDQEGVVSTRCAVA